MPTPYTTHPTSFTKLAVLAIFLILTGVGCIQFQSGAREGDGGIWKTTDQGVHWNQKKTWLTALGLQSIGGVNVIRLVPDPEDHLALYAATTDHGLFYTYDGADSWTQAKQLVSGRVSAISVDAKNKCTVYVAMGQRVWKTTDCSRSFSSSYYEARADVSVTDVKVDWFNSAVLYAGTSTGDLLKSTDGGGHWAPSHRFEDEVSKIYLDPFDSRIVYVGLTSRGIWKTTDAGISWTDLSSGLGDFDRAKGLVAMVGDGVTKNVLLVACRYGILRSTDGGATWSALSLLTPPGSVTIYSLAVNPKDSNEVYYGTGSTFYRSSNGGANWNTEKLPTTRVPTALLVDAQDGKIIFMGTTLIKK